MPNRDGSAKLVVASERKLRRTRSAHSPGDRPVPIWSEEPISIGATPGSQRAQMIWFRAPWGVVCHQRSDPPGSSITGGEGEMALSRWSPMGELAGLHTAMDRLFSDFFGGPLLESGETGSRTWYLPIDVVDQGRSYEVKAAVPGFSPEEVELTYSDGMLNISAQHKQESSSKQGSYLRRELSYGSFGRSVQLPGDVKEEQIKASFENGILVIEIHKVPAAQPRKIANSDKSQKQLLAVGAQSAWPGHVPRATLVNFSLGQGRCQEQRLGSADCRNGGPPRPISSGSAGPPGQSWLVGRPNTLGRQHRRRARLHTQSWVNVGVARARILQNRPPIGVRFFAHTTDLGIEVWAPSLESCFARAAAGMF